MMSSIPRPCSRPHATLDEDGYLYLPASAQPEGWQQTVDDAAALFDSAAVGEKQLERINSERLQLKFARSLSALPPPLRRCVEVLQSHATASFGACELQDCYALYTPTHETSTLARAPQKWHLDAIKKFPVAALILRGGRATEFPAGPYADFAAGVPERTLESWCESLKLLRAPTWESESVEEWEHFSTRLHEARLVTGDEECDWSKLPVAPAPRARVGDGCVFWSNKVHRGPGTESGEERLVLFCSWLPVAQSRPAVRGKGGGGSSFAAAAQQSETDYSFYDTHLEPKLRLSERAQRSLGRLGGAQRVGAGARTKRQRAP
jgi:hypothetical protein